MKKLIRLVTIILMFASTTANSQGADHQFQIHVNAFQYNNYFNPYYNMDMMHLPAGVGFKYGYNNLFFGININYLNKPIDSWEENLDNSTIVFGSMGGNIYGLDSRLKIEYQHEFGKVYSLTGGIGFAYSNYQIDDKYYSQATNYEPNISHLFADVTDQYLSIQIGHDFKIGSMYGVNLNSSINFHQIKYDQTVLNELPSDFTSLKFDQNKKSSYYNLAPLFNISVYRSL